MKLNVCCFFLLLMLVASKINAACVRIDNNNTGFIQYECTGNNATDLKSMQKEAYSIIISRMPVGRIDEATFSDFINLTMLRCIHCELDHIDDNAFDKLVNLQVLDLSYNHLREVKPVWFKELRQLRSLGLSHNDFDSIDGEVFRNLANIVDLRLSGNQLYCLDFPSISGLRNLRRLFIEQSPNFECQNELVYLLRGRGIELRIDRVNRRMSILPIEPHGTLESNFETATKNLQNSLELIRRLQLRSQLTLEFVHSYANMSYINEINACFTAAQREHQSQSSTLYDIQPDRNGIIIYDALESSYKNLNVTFFYMEKCFQKVKFDLHRKEVSTLFDNYKQSSPFILTHLGGIEGTYKESFNGRIYEAYEGVPYASPPVGKRRFMPPEPIKPWSGNLSATTTSKICIQYAHIPINAKVKVQGVEDCLYLNIYVPLRETSRRLPVLFAIHGGAFQFGRSYVGAKFLMDKDVIVVTINYRLGPFGFLSTENETVPGNMGLKDQSLALRWVSENIQYFGGDPKKITLIGQSAGGASVHYHYLSPLSKGLFRNGISFSGTALVSSKLTKNAREKAKKLGAVLGCTTKSVTAMVECLWRRPAESVSGATVHFMPWLYTPCTPFGPVVEKVGKHPFIDRPPYKIISSGDVSDKLWINGVVSEDGLYPAAEYVNHDDKLVYLNENWEKVAPHLLNLNYTIPLENHDEVSRKIRNRYFGTKPINRESVMELTHLIGDRSYFVDAEKASKAQAKVNKSPVLFWYYSYRALTSVSDRMSESSNNYGVSHGDDITMIFDTIHIYPPSTKRDRDMQIKWLDFVVSVAEEGYPNNGFGSKWEKVNGNKEALDFLHIAGPDNITMASDDNLGQKRFWASIHFTENV